MGISRRLQFLFTVVVVATLLASILPPVFAQSTDTSGALNLTTSPLPISLVAKPGESVSTQLRVRNSGNTTETLKVGLMKFSAFGDSGKPLLAERGPTDQYFDWVKFSTTQFKAEPNVWNEITMTIDVPTDAAFGYYYAVTFSRANPTTPDNHQAATLQGGTATLVLLEAKSPNAKKVLELTSFEVSKKIYEFLPAHFTISLKNTGNVHVAPIGTIYISKGSKQIDTVPVNLTQGNILPSSGRVFSVDWSKGFPVYEPREDNGSTVLKNGKTQYDLNWKINEIKNLRFGRYTAHLTMIYDNGTRDVPLDATVSFWVIPWRLIAVFIGIPLAFFGVIIYLIVSRRKYKKKATKVNKA